jgi:transcriptional antiterminator RfaH
MATKMDTRERTESTRHFGHLFWFVIHTKSRDEYRVKNNLGGMGIETLLPLYKNYKSLRERICPVVNPLFPNYVFARLNLAQHYYKVKWTRGVNRILGVGAEPTPISDTVIQTLKEQMDKDNTVQLLEDLKEGNKVQITSGPLRDFVGVFQKGMSSGGRVRILLSLIGKELPVQICRWQIKKVA